MRKVLCFGDSNTFGFNPKTFGRYSKEIRWTGVLQELCGEEYEIIEAGCNNRTAFCDNPEGNMQNGYKILPEYLSGDLDYVVFAIGINDLQKKYSINSEIIQLGLMKLVNLVYEICKDVKIILILPTRLDNSILKGGFSALFDKNSICNYEILASNYKEFAKKMNIELIDLNNFVTTSKFDGLHFEPDEHKIIAQLVKNVLN